MASRRVIKGVLGNFLGTFVSRYSDYKGYLLFGFLVADLGELNIDLLGAPVSDPSSPLGVTVLSAAARFDDQRQKAGLSRSHVREACLRIRRMPGSIVRSINGHSCAGFNVSFSATAVMDNDNRFEMQCAAFIAPHNRGIELKSTRTA
jgi:hypothetical protein